MDIRIAGSPLDGLDFPVSGCWSAPGRGRYFTGARNLKGALASCGSACKGASVCGDPEHDVLCAVTKRGKRDWGIDWWPVQMLSGCNLALADYR